MSLDVYVFVLDENGEPSYLEPGTMGDELAGFESTRTRLWGSDAVGRLGLRFLPRLTSQDLHVQPDEIEAFLDECTVVQEHLAAIADDSGYPRDYLTERVRNIIVAAERAKVLTGGVAIS